MDNKRIQIIFPKDETTDFLNEIIAYLDSEKDVNISLHRITTIDDHLDFLNEAEKLLPVDEVVIFMGHGMSSALSGADIPKNPFSQLIKENDLSIFKKRKVVLLSCKSNEYLHGFGLECGLAAGIGFPNMITDPYEILYPQELNERVDGITEKEIELFKNIIVDIMKFSLQDYINRNLSFYQLFKRLKIRSQKALLEYYFQNNNQGVLPFGKMLYDLNDGISFMGN